MIAVDVQEVIDANPDCSDHQIANLLINRAFNDDRWRGWLIVLISDQVRRMRRDTARTTESKSFRGSMARVPVENTKTAAIPVNEKSPIVAALFDSLQTAVKDHADKMYLTVTDKLLETEFALGSGRRVTWGEATIQEHQERIELLEKYTLSNAESAARHQAAINLIQDSGIRCLRESVQVAA